MKFIKNYAVATIVSFICFWILFGFLSSLLITAIWLLVQLFVEFVTSVISRLFK